MRVFPSATPGWTITEDYTVDTTATSGLQTTTPAAPSTSALLAQIEKQYGLNGRGQTVVIIDSGVAYTHTALGGGFGAGYRVVGGYDFALQDGNPYDFGPDGSHGTHVAGIIASSNSRYPGVAPGVDIVALRVFDNNGNSSVTWVQQALQWVHDHRNSFEYPITTVNLSLGVTWNGQTPPPNAPFETQLAQLYNDGIFIAAAAGNNFSAAAGVGVSYPAASPYVVPVASADPNGTLSSFSQRDSKVIAAPGRSIMSTVPDYAGNGNGIDDDFARYSGTSMASPYVAGAAILMREAYQLVGVHNINEAMIYREMLVTADTIHDTVTGKNYAEIDLAHALQDILAHGATTVTVSAAGTSSTATPNVAATGNVKTASLYMAPRTSSLGLGNDSSTVTANVYGVAATVSRADFSLSRPAGVTGYPSTTDPGLLIAGDGSTAALLVSSRWNLDGPRQVNFSSSTLEADQPYADRLIDHLVSLLGGDATHTGTAESEKTSRSIDHRAIEQSDVLSTVSAETMHEDRWIEVAQAKLQRSAETGSTALAHTEAGETDAVFASQDSLTADPTYPL